jgi:hypothetical protein
MGKQKRTTEGIDTAVVRFIGRPVTASNVTLSVIREGVVNQAGLEPATLCLEGMN